MNRYGYQGPEQFRPLSAWAYVGYSLLFCIPLVGFILLIVFALSDANINRRSYARSYFCWLLLSILLVAIPVAIAISTGTAAELLEYLKQLQYP